MADELKAAGNKAIAEKNFDEAMYVGSVCLLTFSQEQIHQPPRQNFQKSVLTTN